MSESRRTVDWCKFYLKITLEKHTSKSLIRLPKMLQFLLNGSLCAKAILR